MTRRTGRLDSCPPWCEADHRGVLHAPHGREIGDVKDGRASAHISLVWDPHGPQIFRESVVMLRAYGPEDLLAGHERPLVLMDASDAGHVAPCWPSSAAPASPISSGRPGRSSPGRPAMPDRSLSLKHPARGSAVESLPQAGLVSPANDQEVTCR
jgi:hypothetical protein